MKKESEGNLKQRIISGFTVAIYMHIIPDLEENMRVLYIAFILHYYSRNTSASSRYDGLRSLCEWISMYTCIA